MDFIIMLIFISIGILLLIIKNIQKRNLILERNKENNNKFCILIPARYESEVIENLLKSINESTVKVNNKDVYVIIETLEDPTYKIVKNYDMNIILRKNLNLKRKGYALEEAFDYLKINKKEYDLYFIFDADNILDKDFIKNMLISYNEGYDIACGYRGIKNKKLNVISISSILTFSLINTISNNNKSKKGKNVVLSGTGFYLSKKVIKDKYKFHTLTEDYELSLYSIINNFNSTYNLNAIYYDEQPNDYKTTVNQRLRWIKGYLEVRKKYSKILRKNIFSNHLNKASIIDEYIGMKPYVLMLLGILLFLIVNIIKLNFLKIIILLSFIYFMLVFLTIILLYVEKDNIKLSVKYKILEIFYNPLFILSYILCFFKAICTKNVEWKRIDHNNK